MSLNFKNGCLKVIVFYVSGCMKHVLAFFVWHTGSFEYVNPIKVIFVFRCPII